MTGFNFFFPYLISGFSAYELWKQSVAGGNINWPKDQTTMEHFFLYLKGKDGENGITPHVGENGNWYIGNRDTNWINSVLLY
jgi:hypothetical protein